MKKSTAKTVQGNRKLVKKSSVRKVSVGRPSNKALHLKLSALWISGKPIEDIATAGCFKNVHVAYQRIATLRKQYGEVLGEQMFPRRDPGRK